MCMVKCILIACLFGVFTTLTEGGVHSTRFKGIETLEKQWIERLRKIYDSVNAEKNKPRSVTLTEERQTIEDKITEKRFIKSGDKKLIRSKKIGNEITDRGRTFRNGSAREEVFTPQKRMERAHFQSNEEVENSKFPLESQEQQVTRSTEEKQAFESKEQNLFSSERLGEKTIPGSEANTGNIRARDSTLLRSEEETESADDFADEEEQKISEEEDEEEERENPESEEQLRLNFEEEDEEENESDSSEEEFGRFASGKLGLFSGEISYEDLKDSSVDSFFLENRVRGFPVYERKGLERRLKGIVLLGSNKGGQARYISVEEESSEEDSYEIPDYLTPQREAPYVPYYNSDYYRRLPYIRIYPQAIDYVT